MYTAVALVASIVILLANGFFVASEFAIVKMRPTRLEDLVRRNNRRAVVAQKISRNLDAYLSANQLGITLSSLALGWLGEPAFAVVLEPFFSDVGDWSRATTHTVSMVASFAIITFLHTVVGELAPKSLAIQRTERVALWTAIPLRAFYVVMFPVIWVLNKAAGAVLALLGLGRGSELAKLHTPEELRLFLRGGDLAAGPRDVMDRLFDYTNRTAAEVMTLANRVVTLDAKRSWKHNMGIALRAQFSRYPVIDGEKLLGYVLLKDIFAASAAGRRARSLRELVRTPLRARADTPLEELRRLFLLTRVHLAIIEDSHGRFAGIVTFEDLLEEFIGEILDEHDTTEVAPLVRDREGGFVASGRVTLDVAARELGVTFNGAMPSAKTLSDYVRAHLGADCAPGMTVAADNYVLTVLEMRDGAVERVRGSRARVTPAAARQR